MGQEMAWREWEGEEEEKGRREEVDALTVHRRTGRVSRVRLSVSFRSELSVGAASSLSRARGASSRLKEDVWLNYSTFFR